MAIAYVGQSALAVGSTTCTPVYGSATAGNLLIALFAADMATPATSTLSGATTGWTQRSKASGTNTEAEIWDKTAVGSDTMPTWNISGGTLASVLVVEFSGAGAFDQQGTNTTLTTSPATVTATGTDAGPNELIVAIRQVRGPSSGLNTTSTDNVNSQGVGTNVTVIGDDGGTSQVAHRHSLYSITSTTGSSADTDVGTWTFTSAHGSMCIASWKVGGGTLYTQTLSGSSTSSPSVATVRSRLIALSASVTSTPTITGIRARLVHLSASVSSTATVTATRVRTALLTVTSTSTASMSRLIGKVLSVTSASTPTIAHVRSRFVSLVLSSASTVSLTAARVRMQLLSAASSSTATLATQRIRSIVLSVTSTSSAAIQKFIAKTLSVVSSSLASVVGYAPGQTYTWLNTPAGWQPWDVAAAYQVTSWDTETYQGSGLGVTPALNQTVLVANVQMGSYTLKIWIDAASVQPLG